jgi:hypothetical protein
MKLLSVLIVAALLLPASAHAEFKGCYERVYDKTYMRKHKRQDIAKMRLQLGVGQGSDGAFELLDRVDAVFRNGAVYRGNLIACKISGAELACNIEGEGGSFIVTDRGQNSIRISNQSRMHFGAADSKLTIKNQGDNKEFRLYRVSQSACP